MKKELLTSQFDDNGTLNGRPDWVVALAFGAFALVQINEIIKQVKPMVQPFIDKYQGDMLVEQESASRIQVVNVQSDLPLV